MSRFAIVLVLILSSSGFLNGAIGGGFIPLTELSREADIVAVASFERATTIDGVQRIELKFIRILQGDVGSVSVSAKLDPPRGVTSPQPYGLSSLTPAGLIGVWFLKAEQAGYRVLPMARGPYREIDLFVPVESGAGLPLSGTVSQQLLAYLVSAYLSADTPIPSDDQRLFTSLSEADAADALRASAPLLTSVSLHQRAMGLAISIRHGSEAGISALPDEIRSFKGDRNRLYIMDSIKDFRITTGKALSSIEKLIALGPEVPGLDSALASALVRLGTKASVPGMVRLVRSKDPNAQLQAARFLGYYAQFADESGAITGTGVAGPFGTEETRRFTPNKESTLRPDEYGGFWTDWWVQNRSKLGF